MNSMTEADFAPKKEFSVYLIECVYTTIDNKSLNFSFRHVTAEPIESHYSYIINIICRNTKLSINTIFDNYFDLQIFEIDKICF